MADEKYVEYHITGVTRSGARFRIETTNPTHAFGINLYRGTVWGVRKDGSREKLRSTWN